MANLEANDYIVCASPQLNAKVRLVCFPHAGGGPSAFAAWGDLLEDKLIEVVAVSAPGRERRIHLPPITDSETLIQEICEAIEATGIPDGLPYAFFGHSLGAVLAFEVARQLDIRMIAGRPRPLHVFASGHGGPSTMELGRDVGNWGRLHTLSDAELMETISTFGFVPDDLATNKDLLRAVVPALRGDFQLYEDYKRRSAAKEKGRTPIATPITALGGAADALAPVAHLATWQRETSRWPQEAKVFPGGHFYLHETVSEVLSFVTETMQESIDAQPRAMVKSRDDIPQLCYEKLMHEVIFEQALMHPDKDAVVDANSSVTFAELVHRVKLLGRELWSSRFLDGKKTQVVGMLMPHNCDYVITMLGIWYAAGIIIPVEAHFTDIMCVEVLEEAKACAMISSPQHAHKFQSVENCRTFVMGNNWAADLERLHEGQGLEEPARPDIQDIGMLMFTSGTTGRPKTIAGSHLFLHKGALAKEIVREAALNDENDCREGFNVMFVWEVIRSPLKGYTAFVIPDEGVLDPKMFVGFMAKHQLSRCLTTPTLLATLLAAVPKELAELKSLRVWVMCGEVMPMKVVLRFREVVPWCKILNDYSTWESGDIGYSIVSPAGKYQPSKIFAGAGQFISTGMTALVVDPETRKTLPVGFVGELYVGGDGMSYGYYGQPEATAAKFVDGFNPEMIAAQKGQSWKWYTTGDLARFVGDPAQLEIRGRCDSTVKIRGFKVGIPIVEAAIMSVPGVEMAPCFPIYENPASVDSLLCYVKPKAGVTFEELLPKIKLEAVKLIPRWMMPTYWQPFPENAFSGGEARKLNRRLLSTQYDLKTLKEMQLAAKSQTSAPTFVVDLEEEGSVRSVLRSVWAKVLNLPIEMVDPEENFFDLGGQSAMAAKMASELSDEYGLPVSVLDIYAHSTLQALIGFVEAKAGNAENGPQTALDRQTSDLLGGLANTGAREVPAVVVAGLAGRFPGADDAETFYENIKRAAVSATFLSKDFLRGKGVPESTIGHKDFVPCAYIVRDIDQFDNKFFGINRHEASMMDPQHRVFIETSWAALENAGIPPKAGLANSNVGVFAAAGIDGYLHHHLDGRPLKDTMEPGDVFFAEIGHEKDYIATRVSYLFDFTGPSMNVNSACSSALVAVSQGASAIAFGQCDAAIAGASSLTFPNLGYLYADGLVNSVDGFVRPFDAGADGTVFGDAVASLVIRRQADLGVRGLAYAGLRGFAVSNDGASKAGYAAPSSTGQARAVTGAMRMLGEDPWSLSYVECHATGTKIGDGIEIHGLISAFEKVGGKAKGDAHIALGSVKGNIAHANCAAGATGLIKTLIMMDRRELAPVANFKMLNPKINLKNTPFFINNEVCPWERRGSGKLLAGVSSFGIGGTNAHTILEEVVRPTEDQGLGAVSNGHHPLRAGFQLLPFSAKSPGGLRQTALRMASCLKQGGKGDGPLSMAEVAYTLQAGRMGLPLRKALVVPADISLEALHKAAEALESQLPDVEELEEIEDAKKRPPVAFVFPGQGSQYLGMARGLYDQVALFRTTADQCCEMLAAPGLLGRDLRPLLFGDGLSDEEFDKPSVLQPALFVVEFALAQVFLAAGVKPVACAGHSLGEYTASVVGGFLTLESALAIVSARAKSTETLAEVGAMLSIADWSSEELEAVGAGSRKGLWLAAVNSPMHAVVSGEVEAVAALEAELKAAGRKCSRLHVKRAFHSELIGKAADTLKGLGNPPATSGITTLPVASNLSGAWMSAAQLKDGQYWTKHMRGTVLWRENAERLLSQWRPAIVLEVGPGNVLSTLTSKCVQQGGHAPNFVQAMRHPKSTGTHDVEALFGALGKLWEAGCPINWEALHTAVSGSASPPSLRRLSTYAFEPTSLWVNPERSVYLDVTEDPSPAAYIASEASVTPVTSSRVLVRYGEDRDTEPSIRAYCLPFASGNSTLFAPWAQNDAAVEVIAIELPGRGARSEEAMPKDDAGDEAMLEGLCRTILADLGGAQLVLVGFSMGGGLCMQLALRLTAMKDGRLPLAVYVAGRNPPAAHPSLVPGIDMTDAELAAYAFAPPEAAQSPEFQEFVLPLLRGDLEVDARGERRLSAAALAGKRLPASIGVQLFCGTCDPVAPWAEAPGWQRLIEAQVGINYMPGGHEFMQECRPMIQASWRRDAIGRLVQRRTAEVALLAAQGMAAPGMGGSWLMSHSQYAPPGCFSPPGGAPAPPSSSLPLYAVRWVPATLDYARLNPKVAATPGGTSVPPFFINLNDELSPGILEAAEKAAKAGAQLVVACMPTAGVLAGQQAVQDEVRLGWHFVKLVQQLMAAGASARILVVCPASASGALVAGSSKAVAQEASELKIQRLFLPSSCMAVIKDSVGKICDLAARYSGETDLWLQEASLRGVAFAPRLERVAEPISKMPTAVRSRGADGELAIYLLTGATGGLGKAVVNWLLKEQGLLPEQLVLLRRSSSAPLEGALATCRVVEVSKVDCVETLSRSALKKLKGVYGIFHLAGVLDDGVVGGMTEERMQKVAQPKCGMLTALLNCAKELDWPMQWALGFSSTSSLFGYAGQTNYCAANAMLDQMATFGGAGEFEGDRTPCKIVVVNWGPWGEAGMAQVGTKAYEQAVKEGDTPLTTAAALSCLGVALRLANQAHASSTQLCACDVDWAKSQWQDLPILEFVHEGGAANSESPKEEVTGAPVSKQSAVEAFLSQSSKSGGSWSRVKGKSLHHLGLDSLELVQIRNLFNKKFNVNVPLGVVADPSQKLSDLAVALLKFVES
eukprot:CAMPEP_0115159844 /NCGR_PEP_ID=MMETSP0227-20121206/70471_1 /TAXON_ID=89957 /ORGANISM="Polarella glacialis, Strain CCMP 1383" /LENGTH=2756 /DNA_ID=CAMNT_0002571667 /DNA_START=136 /DNA_END=8406 /DNA_ORIENTATION=+